MIKTLRGSSFVSDEGGREHGTEKEQKDNRCDRGASYCSYRFAMPQGTKGDKSITVTVVHGDETEKVFEYDTDEEYLGPVVTEDGLVEGEEGEFGLFITTVDGETADEAKQEWWCVTKGGEMTTVSVSEQVIEDGDAFELTLTVGY